MTQKTIQRGFTLVEMAVVLIILGILIGGLIIPLTSQQELRKIDRTREELKHIQDALIGFAIINGRLPCPSSETDPTNANYGVEDASCSTSYAGNTYLPWKTLGVPEIDEWGITRKDAAAPVAGLWVYRVDRNFTTANAFSTNMVSVTPSYGDLLSIVDSSGNALNTSTERPIAVVLSLGKDRVGNGNNSSYEGTSGMYESNELSTNFDDIITWISRPALLHKMVTAEKLP